MKLFTNQKVIKTDLGKFTLADALEKLEQEAFFKNDASFYLINKLNENHLIFGVPRDRATSSQVHEFKYNEVTKNIEVNSKYEDLLFPGLIIYLMPLQAMYIGGIELVMSEWQTFLYILMGITAYNLFLAKVSLKNQMALIERALAIRLNYLGRNKR